MTVVLGSVNAFHVLGGILALWAVLLTAVGIRNAGFPGSARGARVVSAISTVLVIGAISAGIITAATEEGEGEEQGAPPDTQAGETEAAPPAREVAGDPQAGRAVFSAAGCGSCHTLEAAGTDATIGPNLDETLVDKDQAYVRQSIVEPDAAIAEGFGPGVMPQDFQDRLSDRELNDIVAFVSEATRP